MLNSGASIPAAATSSFPGWKRTLALKKDKSAKRSVVAGLKRYKKLLAWCLNQLKVTAPLAMPLGFLLPLLLVLLSALYRLRVFVFSSPSP